MGLGPGVGATGIGPVSSPQLCFETGARHTPWQAFKLCRYAQYHQAVKVSTVIMYLPRYEVWGGEKVKDEWLLLPIFLFWFFFLQLLLSSSKAQARFDNHQGRLQHKVYSDMLARAQLFFFSFIKAVPYQDKLIPRQERCSEVKACQAEPLCSHVSTWIDRSLGTR